MRSGAPQKRKQRRSDYRNGFVDNGDDWFDIYQRTGLAEVRMTMSWALLLAIFVFGALLVGWMAAIFVAGRRVDAPQSVLRRLLLPIAALLLVPLVTAGAILYQQHQQRLAGH